MDITIKVGNLHYKKSAEKYGDAITAYIFDNYWSANDTFKIRDLVGEIKEITHLSKVAQQAVISIIARQLVAISTKEYPLLQRKSTQLYGIVD